jgi:hypothetical protein
VKISGFQSSIRPLTLDNGAIRLVGIDGLVVTDEETAELDIAVKNGKIAKVALRGTLSGVSKERLLMLREEWSW